MNSIDQTTINTEIGYIYNINTDGHLVNNLSKQDMQTKWLNAVNGVVSLCEGFFEDNLHSIYIRGSIAEGHAYDNRSDIDLMIVLNDQVAVKKGQLRALLEAQITNFRSSVDEYLKDKHPYVTYVDYSPIILIDKLLNDDSDNSAVHRFLIKYQSVHVYGINIQDSLKHTEREDIPMYHSSLGITMNQIRTLPLDIRIHADIIKWTARRIIRSTFGIVNKNLNIYTKSLVPCYNLFVDEYPDKKEEMKSILEIAVLGVEGKTPKEFKSMLKMGEWLLIKLKEYYDR
jgi:predicted nucleotidyltransferase